jgi:hypothetical protein
MSCRTVQLARHAVILADVPGDQFGGYREPPRPLNGVFTTAFGPAGFVVGAVLQLVCAGDFAATEFHLSSWLSLCEVRTRIDLSIRFSMLTIEPGADTYILGCTRKEPGPRKIVA